MLKTSHVLLKPGKDNSISVRNIILGLPKVNHAIADLHSFAPIHREIKLRQLLEHFKALLTCLGLLMVNGIRLDDLTEMVVFIE